MLTSEKQISVICPLATSCENQALPPEEAGQRRNRLPFSQIVMLSEERAYHRWPVDFAEKNVSARSSH